MSYKIVKNADGEIVAFGLDNEQYEPTIKNGETLTIESDKVAEDLIKKYRAKELANYNQLAQNKAALLERLGITAAEAALLLS